MSEQSVAPAQTNTDAASPPSATPSADAGTAPPAAPAATAAPAADAVTTALGGGNPAPAAPTTPPAGGEAPADYQAMVDSLTLPDGVADSLAFQAEEKSVLKTLAEKAQLSAEQLKAVHDELIATRANDRKQLEQQVQAWSQQLRSDPELSGEDGKLWPTTQANIERVFAVGDTAELRQFFNQTGLGNHPLFVKHYAAIGALLAPDATRATQSAAAPESQRAADVLYPNM